MTGSPSPPARATATILEQLGPSRPLALYLDYDGTLAPFAPRPELAILPAGTHAVLRRLVANPRVHVAIISSRRAADVAELVPLEDIDYVGLSGLERRRRGGDIVRHPELAVYRPALDQAIDELQLADLPGAWIEDKYGALSVHHRDLAPDKKQELQTRVRRCVDKHPSALRFEPNAFTIEVVPRLTVDKGTALRDLARESTPAALPVFAGDDTNDAPAMRQVLALDGIALGVGPNAPSEATLCLESPAALCSVFEGLAKSLHVPGA